MKNNEPATNNHQQPGNVSDLLTPEMRRQILKLKDELNEHDLLLSGQLDILNNIHDALEIARCSADCLLTSDPF
jgi:hypothetical protein